MAVRRASARLAAVAVLSAAVAVSALGTTSATEGAVGVGTVELRVRPGGPGGTQLVLPPLGRITARTHGAPLTVSAEVVQLDVERVQAVATSRDPGARLRDEATDDVGGQVRRMVLKALLLSALVGAVVAALVPGRRWRYLPVGALAAAVAAGGALGWAWRGYDPAAFERAPTFEGALERAPALLATVRRHVDEVDVVRSRVGRLGSRIADLYTATSAAPDDADGALRVLHVSDIHSNPLAVEVVLRLVESFDVDAVLDTGDLTTFGSPLEARIVELLGDLDVPYLLVPGNHDSPANRAAFDASRNVELLDREVASLDGVRVLGVPDPTFTADNRTSTEEANAAKANGAPAVGRLVRAGVPDVLAVHDVRQATAAIGDVPVVVAGHTHERSSRVVDGTLVLTVGSTGATGLGSFTADSDLAYEAEILHFAGDGSLTGLDYVSLPGFDGSFTVEHLVLDRPPRAAPSPQPPPGGVRPDGGG